MGSLVVGVDEAHALWPGWLGGAGAGGAHHQSLAAFGLLLLLLTNAAWTYDDMEYYPDHAPRGKRTIRKSEDVNPLPLPSPPPSSQITFKRHPRYVARGGRGGPETMQMSDEKRLIKHLLENYERVGIVGRPVYNTSETVHVSYGLALIQILDLDEKNQVLTTNVWSRYHWKDILLQWKPEEFGGVDHVRVPSDAVWKPDIVLYNYADTRLTERRDAMVVVDHTGNVLWIPMSILKSSCAIDILYFPYDEQTCHLKFGSWTYDGHKLDLNFYDKLESVDVTDYIPSNEWVLTEYPAVKNTIYYPCCKEPYPDLTFTVKLRRMPIFYGYVLLLPCILLSTLTLTSFWLPPESPAKILLGMSVFVAFFLLLRILAASTPPASASVPLLGAYFCLNMVLLTLSSFVSVVVINLNHRVDKKTVLPPLARKIFIEGLARLFCMNHYPQLQAKKARKSRQDHVTHVIETDSLRPGRKTTKEKKTIKSPILKYNKWEPPANDTSRESPMLMRNHTPDRSPVHGHLTHFETDVREIKNAFKNFMNKLTDGDTRNKINLEWRIVAATVDRLLFWIFLVTIAVALTTIFPWSPGPNASNSTGL